MIWVVGGCVAVLTAGAVLAVVRIVRGPHIYDRMVGMDILMTVVIVAVALEAAWHRRTESVPVLGALALVGFVGSATVARLTGARRRPSGGAARAPGRNGGVGGASDAAPASAPRLSADPVTPPSRPDISADPPLNAQAGDGVGNGGAS